MFPWEKYSDLWLLIRITGSLYIFHSKMSELMIGLEAVRTFLDYSLFITKGGLDDHLDLDKLRRVLIRLQVVGLKVNASKSSFCPMENEY